MYEYYKVYQILHRRFKMFLRHRRVVAQNFVLIQPRTSPPKICKTFERCIFEKCIFENAFSKNAVLENAFFENFANFWRARSRLYQNEILQENMRLTAFFKLYKVCMLLHRCNLLIFAKKIGLKIQQFS